MGGQISKGIGLKIAGSDLKIMDYMSGSIQIKKKMGPSIEPWGMPESMRM